MFIPTWVWVVLFVLVAWFIASQYNRPDLIGGDIKGFGLDLLVLCGVGAVLVFVWTAYEGIQGASHPHP